MIVDDDEATVVDVDARSLEPGTFRTRAPADAHDDRVDLERLRRIAGRVPHGQRVAIDTFDRDARDDLDAALLERAHHLVGRLLVDAGQDRGHRLEQRHLAADVREVRRELAPDRATTDDRGARGDLVQHEEVIGGQDLRAVERDAGELTGHGSGREDQRVAHELGAVRHPDVVGRRVHDRAGAGDDRHLASLEEGLEALRQLVDDLLLARLARREVQGGLAGVHSELLRGADGAQDLGGLEELLGGYTATMQTGTTDPGLLDHGDAEPRGCAVEGGGVPAGPSTQDDDVEPLSHRAHHLRVGALRRSLCPQATDHHRVRHESAGHGLAMRIWIAPAARMANPVTNASNISVRVFMPPSSPQPVVAADSPGSRSSKIPHKPPLC